MTKNDRRVMEVHQNVFWSEWKKNVDIPYEEICDNIILSQGAIEICAKVSYIWYSRIVFCQLLYV